MHILNKVIIADATGIDQFIGYSAANKTTGFDLVKNPLMAFVRPFFNFFKIIID